MFLEECRSMYLELTQNKTTVFEPGGKSWKKVKARDIRDISTVIIKAEVKSKLLKDFKAFLDPDTRLWYWERGIPYQRGYLLYGPPGTGKTSLSACLAGCGRLDIYVLSLSSTNEQALNALFNELPSHCVLLLEDVDAVVTTQARQAEDASDDDKTDSGKEGKQKAKGGISLSALLNALDGVSAPEGRVLAMTTNHPERLDPALIRPGRVDLKIELGFADREIIVNLFRFIYKSPGAKAGEDPEFEKVAAAFADKMPDKEFTAAEIMSHLVENRLSPGGALANAEAWITRTREERMKSKRVGSWALNG
jgi:chaperone BCS1